MFQIQSIITVDWSRSELKITHGDQPCVMSQRALITTRSVLCSLLENTWEVQQSIVFAES